MAADDDFSGDLYGGEFGLTGTRSKPDVFDANN